VHKDLIRLKYTENSEKSSTYIKEKKQGPNNTMKIKKKFFFSLDNSMNALVKYIHDV
jgi:hypothetical protein